MVVAQINVRKDSAGKAGQGRISRISRTNIGKGCVVQLRGGTFSDVEIRNHRESEWKEEKYFCVGSDCKDHESHPSLSAKTRKA